MTPAQPPQPDDPETALSASLSTWRALAEKALKGAPLDTLDRFTRAGVRRGPLFTATDAPSASPWPRPDRSAGWDVRAFVDGRTAQEANRLALAELEGGATSLTLRVDETGEHGLASADLAAALDTVWLDAAPVSLAVWKEESGSQAAMISAAKALVALWDERGYAPDAVRGALHIDPLGEAAGTGAASGSAHRADAWIAGYDLLPRLAEARPNVSVFAADGCYVHEIGADAVVELAWVAASYTEVLRTAAARNISPAITAPRTAAVLATTADVHATIAKLRAARMLIARILAAFDVDPAVSPPVEVWTSGRKLQSQDAWTNQIRTAAAVFAAAAGGADAIVALPFTAPLGRATDKARRIARNQQLVALKECGVGAHADPAAGSFALESLTLGLARSAWARFQEIERAGGAEAYAVSGAMSDDIAEADASDVGRLRTGDAVIVGVTHYANADGAEPETAS